MLHTITEVSYCEPHLRSSSLEAGGLPSASISNPCHAAPHHPRVLVVEFRDEVYAGIRTVLEEFNCNVTRAKLGSVVAGMLPQFVPDLVLINESMPDESGWLVACKLNVVRYRQPIWLYTAQRPHPIAVWKKFSGVGQVIDYGGVLYSLVLHVRQHVSQWMRGLDGDLKLEGTQLDSVVIASP